MAAGSESGPLSLSVISAVICHVVGITYQHIDRWLLAEMLGDLTGKALSGSLVPIEEVRVSGAVGLSQLLIWAHSCLTRLLLKAQSREGIRN